ncbi:MAG TPA: response regulator transcription factor [Coriobacteriia bacterium]|jgi:DNA-binding response OmpR family regulator
MEPKRVLVVDDEESMLKIIRYALEEAGFRVETAEDAETAERVLPSFHPDLIVLDVMLPGASGLEFTRDLRTKSSVPVLMLSAKSEEIDKILGLELGADDYVTKPFSPRELVSRVRAHLRRAAAPTSASNGHTVGDLRIDPDSHQVYMRGVNIHLTTTEFQILEVLSRSPGKVFSRAAILDSLWGGGFVGDERAVDVHVHNIREKIERDPAEPDYLLTVRGIGYRLREA